MFFIDYILKLIRQNHTILDAKHNSKNKYIMNIKQLNKLISKRKALANKQYKARCELKELEEIIDQQEIILKKSGNPPSEDFIKEQNERIDKKCMLLLKIQENETNLMHLDESIKSAKKMLEWNSIFNSKKLRQHIELVLKDVNELQESYQLDMAILDESLRKALTTLHLVAKKLKEWWIVFSVKELKSKLLFHTQKPILKNTWEFFRKVG